MIALLLPLAAFGFYDPSVGRWTTRDPIEEQGGVNLYAFCQNDPVNRYDKDGRAYFVYRPLDFDLARMIGVRLREWDDKNLVFAHEQLIFEDGGDPISIGYFKGTGVHEDSFNMQSQYERLPGEYDDCVMREAVKQVIPRPYVLTTFWVLLNLFRSVDPSQYNCQDYAEALRREYFTLLGKCEIWRKCGWR